MFLYTFYHEQYYTKESGPPRTTSMQYEDSHLGQSMSSFLVRLLDICVILFVVLLRFSLSLPSDLKLLVDGLDDGVPPRLP